MQIAVPTVVLTGRGQDSDEDEQDELECGQDLEPSDGHSDAGEIDPAVSSGPGSDASDEGELARAFRRNLTTQNLLSDEEALELREWLTTQEGPWSNDLSEYPGPGNTSVSLLPCHDGSIRPGEPYHPVLRGLQCEIFRNEYLAWCAVVQLPEAHPYFGRDPNEMNRVLRVHGGLTRAGSPGCGCYMLDCNHAASDLVPFAAFVNARSDPRRIGALGAASLAAAEPQSAHLGVGALGSGGPKLLATPSASAAPPANCRATYKDYAFVRRELEHLVEQLVERQSSVPK